MSITGKIKTLFSDKEKTQALFPRTKVSAVSDDNGVGLNVLLEQTVPMTRGGTGAENGAEGLANMFAAGGTVLSPYQYGTELPSNAAVGQVYFEEATGTIADIGQDVAKALRAVNLLDNSDFKNPVNQRGATSYTRDYSIDRWKANYHGGNGTISIIDNGLVLTPASSGQYAEITQVFDNSNRLIGKQMTFAVKTVEMGLLLLTFEFGVNTIMTKDNIQLIHYDKSLVTIRTTTEAVTLEWALCYEDEYTVETLPPYVPKGYGAELVECMRYYWHSQMVYRSASNSAVSNLNIQFPVRMRISPTIKYSIIEGVDPCSNHGGMNVSQCGCSFYDAPNNIFTFDAFSASADL